MKNIIIAIASITCIALQSCKEEIPAGLVLTKTFETKDTEYVATIIPAPQLKNVLIEEFTGVQCSNCPKGSIDLKAIEMANAPRVLVAKLHNNSLATPIKPSDPDLRTTDAESIGVSLGFVSKPTAAVDKVLNTGTDYTFLISAVAGKVNTQLIKPTVVNINLVKQLNVTADTITLAATFTFTDTTSRKLAYNIYLLEDDIEATQDSFVVATLSKLEIEGYKHEKVLRKTITPAVVGTALPDTLQQKGKVYIRALRFAKPSKVSNINNCVILVFVHDRYTKEVLHCQEVHM